MGACVLTSRVDTHIYRDTESVSLRERAREGQSLLVSDSDCIRMRNNEMLYDFVIVE